MNVKIHKVLSKVQVSKVLAQEDEPVFFEVTVISHDVFHFWKTVMVKQKIYEDNIICNKLYLQLGSVRCFAEKSVF